MSGCDCGAERLQECPECEDSGQACWRCGGEGWVTEYAPTLDTLVVHEPSCALGRSANERQSGDPTEAWTEEDLAHVDDAIDWFLKRSHAVSMPGLEWVRDKIAARMDHPLRFHEYVER